MRKLKKMTAMFVLMTLLVSTFSIFTFTASAETDGYYTYTVTDGKATITDVNTSISGNVTIPSMLGGYPVTSIGESAFENCTKIVSITIPNSVTKISDRAFYNCRELEDIIIPDSVTSIGYETFFLCENLNYNEYDNAYYLGNTTNKYIVLFKEKSTDITSCTINANTKFIYDYAFFSCDNLGSIVIPDTVKSIGAYAFNGCTTATSIKIGKGVTDIGHHALNSLWGISSIEIPESVVNVGIYAFANCTRLTEINFNATAMKDLSRDSYVFMDAGKNSNGITVNIGANVTTIPAYMFCPSISYDPMKITSVVFASNSQCKRVGSGAFGRCEYIDSVYISDMAAWCGIEFESSSSNPTYYSNDLYLNGALVKDLVIPDGVTKVGSYAFNNCKSIETLKIADSVKSIEKYAFEGCTSFIQTEGGVLYADKWVVDHDDNAINVVLRDNTVGISDYAFYDCAGLVSITIPDTVQSIGVWAFRDCMSLKSIIIPDGVTCIEDLTFAMCINLESISIPDSVTSIGDLVFGMCTSLKTIAIPDSVTSIGANVFQSCTSLEKIHCAEGSLAKTYAAENNINVELCSGGTVTCTSRKICDVCSNEYGAEQAAGHSFNVSQSDADSHWNKCANCDVTDTKQAHTYGADNKCTVCEYHNGNIGAQGNGNTGDDSQDGGTSNEATANDDKSAETSAKASVAETLGGCSSTVSGIGVAAVILSFAAVLAKKKKSAEE